MLHSQQHNKHASMVICDDDCGVGVGVHDPAPTVIKVHDMTILSKSRRQQEVLGQCWGQHNVVESDTHAHAINNDSCTYNSISKDLKWSIITKKYAGVGGGNKVMEVALIACEVLGGAGIKIPCQMLVAFGQASSARDHEGMLRFQVVVMCHHGDIGVDLVMHTAGHKVMALVLTVHAVLVLIKVVAMGLVGRPTAAVITAPITAATPAATTTAAATVATTSTAQVLCWASTTAMLPLMGVVLVMVLWGLVITAG
jgi:hypothetical protein